MRTWWPYSARARYFWYRGADVAAVFRRSSAAVGSMYFVPMFTGGRLAVLVRTFGCRANSVITYVSTAVQAFWCRTRRALMRVPFSAIIPIAPVD